MVENLLLDWWFELEAYYLSLVSVMIASAIVVSWEE